MPANPDFKELLSVFNEEKVEYLVVGPHAVIYYAEPRFTKDLDLWVNPTAGNAARVFRALRQFGAPLADMHPEDFTNRELVYQMGVHPNRIDILMEVTGLEFDGAWSRRVKSTYDSVPFALLCKSDLIRTKKATGRPQDLLDLERLESEES